MTVHNRIKTDAPKGGSGTLTVKALTIGGVKKPAGEYTAVTDTWIEGKGKVVVRPNSCAQVRNGANFGLDGPNASSSSSPEGRLSLIRRRMRAVRRPRERSTENGNIPP